MEEEDSCSLFPLHASWLASASQETPLLPPFEPRSGGQRAACSDLGDLALARQRFLEWTEAMGVARSAGVRRDVWEYAAAGFKGERVREEQLDYCCVARNIELRIEK